MFYYIVIAARDVPPMIISITGGTGFIGKGLLLRHLAQGDTVRVLSRRPPQKLDLPPEVHIYRADLTSATAQLQDFVDGADILYHCAGEIRDAARMRLIHVEGTRNLLNTARSRIGRWVQLSSVGVYGPRPEGIVTEQSPMSPAGEYETTKAESERLVVETASEHGISCVILRPSNVFGAGMSNQSLYKMAAMIDRGLFFFIGRPGASANYIHVDNVVHALILCGRSAVPPSRIYNLSDHVSLERFVAIIAQALGKPSPRMRVPEAPVRWSADFAATIGLRLPLTPSRIDALTSRAVYSSDLIIKELGYSHKLSMNAGLRQLVSEAETTS